MRRAAALAAVTSTFALGALTAAPAMAAITVLGSGSANNGTQCVWQVDYDSTTQTVGYEVSGTPVKDMTLSATVVATGKTFTKDVTADLNQGRIVEFSGVPSSLITPFSQKGQVPPVVFNESCTP